MHSGKKIIGTSIPLFSLRSENSKNFENGTINDGIIFLDWLKKTGQNAWQMLPIHETELTADSSNHVKSPYKGFGVGINPKFLSERKFITNTKLLTEFKNTHSFWLSDYTLFCALRDRFKTDDWTKWETDISKRKTKSIEKWKKELKEEIDKYTVEQYLLHKEYESLKNKAEELNIKLIGDMQFYLPFHSPLIWTNQNLFRIDIGSSLTKVSGVPYKKDTMYGRQVWGHPLYNWRFDNNKKIIDLFLLRIKYLSKLFDMLRIDHASGFFRYGVIDLKNSHLDNLENGPGIKAFTSLIKYAKSAGLEVFAEDAGYDLGELRIALKDLNIAGVRVLSCAYDLVHKLIIREHAEIYKYPKNCVVYSSTHDTQTLLGFIKNINYNEKRKLADIFKIDYNSSDTQFAENLRNVLFRTPSTYILIPLQDWLLTSERINTPGTETEKKDNNWLYRMSVFIENLPNINLNQLSTD